MPEQNPWQRGDLLGIDIAADAAALQAGGADYLTRIFRASGALDDRNRVIAITSLAGFAGGSTGQKLRLSVAYADPSAGLATELFVKFSRDFTDPLRDRARFQMDREVEFALLSRNPAFPIRVPACYAADFHRHSGTGILVTDTVAFGRNGIEPQHGKCMDDELAEPLGHYRALITALARLAGTQRSGRLGNDLPERFPFNPAELTVSQRDHYGPEQVQRRVARYADFAAACPQLLPERIRSAHFLAQLAVEAPSLIERVGAVEAYLAAQQDYLALCHWNANIDNAWFWRDGHGDLQCGLLDWGNVSIMPLAMALWGCLSGARTELWDVHLEELLALFASEYERSGGPSIDPVELQRQLLLHVRVTGVNWLLDVPALLQRQIPDLASTSGPGDSRIRDDEAARTRLQMLSVFLNQWATREPRVVPDEL